MAKIKLYRKVISKDRIYINTIYFLMMWCILQDFLLGIIYNYTNNAQLVKLIFYTKDILMAVLFIVALTKSSAKKSYMIIMLLYFINIAIELMRPTLENGSLMSIMASARGLLLLPMFFFIGYSVSDNSYFRNLVKKKYFKVLVIVAIFGIVDYVLDKTVGTKSFWINVVGLGKFMTDIKGQTSRLVFGLPGNFYTYSDAGFFTEKRLVSLWGGPLTAAYSLLLPTVFILTYSFYNKKKMILNSRLRVNVFLLYLSAVVLVSAEYLSITRIIILLIGFIVCYLWITCRKNITKRTNKILFLCIVLVAGFILKFDTILKYLFNGSTIGHVSGISGSISLIGIFGHGISSFGVNTFGTSDSVITESTYLSLAGQLGIFGALLFLILFLMPIFYIYKKTKHQTDFLSKSIVITGLCFIITGIFSEQLTAYTTIMPFYVILGNECRYWENNSENHYKFLFA